MKSIQWLMLMMVIWFSAFGQDKELLFITIHSNLHYVIRNVEGKKAGFNPFTNQKFKEINESYGVFTVDSEDPDIDPPPPAYEFTDDNPSSGEYILTLYGMGLTEYEVFVSMSRTLRDGGKIEIVGVIDSSQIIEYVVRYDRSPGKPYAVEKVIEHPSLRRDLDNCFKLKLLGEKPLYVDLSHRVAKFEEWIQKGDSAKSLQELGKLEKKLDEVFEKSKGHSKDPNHFIKEEAYRILKEDVIGLMGRSTN